METWVLVSIAAAFLQNLRSGIQKRLTKPLSTTGASATRFFFGLPFAGMLLAALLGVTGNAFPEPNARFVTLTATGGIAQILATALLLACFRYRSFATGTTYSKTEGVQAVLIGFVLLGDRVSAGALIGIVASAVGVMLVSIKGASTQNGDTTQVAGMGLLSGALFAVSAVSYRGASLALPDAHFAVRASFTLVIALCFQSALLLVWLRVFQPGQISRIARHWRLGVLAGASGAAASAGWFTAFTLTTAAHVKAVGSIELIFAMLTSWLAFREQPNTREITGMALVMVGVVLTVLAE